MFKHDLCPTATRINNKCEGLQRSSIDDEPADICKSCEEYYGYEEGEEFMPSEVRTQTVYLASPFFTPTQVALVRKLEEVIEGEGFEVYSPSRDGEKLSAENDSQVLRKLVFDDNVEHLTKSDIIVAVIDDRDPGTIWEMGCRYGRWADDYRNVTGSSLDKNNPGAPAILTYTDHNYGVNLMLLNSIMGHCMGIDELKNQLNRLRSEGLSHAKVDLESTGRVKVI